MIRSLDRNQKYCIQKSGSQIGPSLMAKENNQLLQINIYSETKYWIIKEIFRGKLCFKVHVFPTTKVRSYNDHQYAFAHTIIFEYR